MGTYFICPYYKSEGVHTISCEDTIRHFADKQSHVKSYCASDDWKKCPHASKLEHIYAKRGAVNNKDRADASMVEIKKLLAKLGKLEARMITLQNENEALRHQNNTQRAARQAAEEATKLAVQRRLLSESLLASHLKKTNTYVIDPQDAITVQRKYKVSYEPTGDGKLNVIFKEREAGK